MALSCKEQVNKVVIENSYLIHSISPKDTKFDDLLFLVEKLQNKKVVLLGESGHGDGLTFKAKTRLIQFLHEKLGYQVIAFEGATIFDMYHAGSSIKKGKSAKIASQEFSKGLFTAWSASKEFKDFTHYIGNHADSLSLVGIDNNFAMTSYAKYFPKYLNEILNIAGSSKIDFEAFLRVHKLMLSNPNQLKNDSSFSFAHFVEDIEIIKEMVNTSAELSSLQIDYFSHELENFISYVKGIQMGFKDSVIPRDCQMASNLSWAIDHYYPNEKVIVWTANFHAAKNLDQVIYAKGDNLYQRFKSLAQYLSEQYGEDQVYSIATTSVEGETNAYPKPATIKIPPTSWDYQLAQELDDDYYFIDFETIRKSELSNTEFESTLLGYQPHEGKWYNVFDGVLFIREMKASTFN